MLQKYQNFKKLSRTSQCSFYQANIRQNNQRVLIKRIKQQNSWSQLLKGQSLKIQSKQPYFPKLIQIFKSKGSYFIVYQRPHGLQLNFHIDGIKKQLQQFYQLFWEICKVFKNLKNQVKDCYILPQWIFLHRNTIKLCHFQPYFNKKQALIDSNNKQLHVFMFNLHKSGIQNSQIQSNQRIKNIYFNLGYIAYHLLTGKVTDFQQNFSKKVKEIQLNSKAIVLKITNDPKLATLIEKLLLISQYQANSDQSINLFCQMLGFVNKKNVQYQKIRPKQTNRVVEVTMQKMTLYTKQSKIRTQKKKKSLRPCCIKRFEDQPSPQQPHIQSSQFKLVERYKLPSRRSLDTHQRQKSKFHSHSNLKTRLQLTQKKKIINRNKINASCFLPLIQTQKKQNLTNINKINNRSTMFKIDQKA